ncbi:SGNH/GDSL hydrolase family protein [Sphingobacterium yanglingense]|uniref:GDSL-like lipase/acylhydrolase family protein n=1 Tax=Sphingobacterium yanglingense TaxID=1437280 RepID=A0A4V3DDB0_9SPHI|nr:SGNH/GDSL hydrolase family protein [Sphingobacterium yanglingense]TDQ75680.1 GDSL-like lipase/acylhydrolase family protein [Sphingobacterium yanglingense]
MKRFKKNIKLYIGLVACALATSCAPEIDNAKPNENTGTSKPDFSKYIAIGNSLTAGFADGGLYLEGQQLAFPVLLAEKMKAHGGGEFKSPFFTESQSNGSGYIRLKALVNGQPVTEPVTDKLAVRGLSPNNTPLYTKYTDEVNNLGVPGMRLDMVNIPGLGSVKGNPYFERLLTDQEVMTTYRAFATSKNHTFFSFSLGNNDALGYATNGGVEKTDGTSTLTDINTFGNNLTDFINDLTTNNRKGVIATIPDVSAVPFLTTVTRQALLQAATAASQAQGGPAVTALFIATKAGTRPATDKDMFVLPFASSGLLGKPNDQKIPYGLHPNNPIESQYVLDEAEVAEVKTRIDQYNKKILEVANSRDLAVADIHAFLNKVKNGYVYNGITISNKYITGNVFSLDGVHLTPIGYAIMANIFIDAINAKYGTQLDKVDAMQYRGVKMP